MLSNAVAAQRALPALGWLLGLACLQRCERLPLAPEYAALLLSFGLGAARAALRPAVR